MSKVKREEEEEKNYQFTKPVIYVRNKKEEENIRRTFYVNKHIIKKLDNMSELTGVPKGKILERALIYYFSQVEIKDAP